MFSEFKIIAGWQFILLLLCVSLIIASSVFLQEAAQALIYAGMAGSKLEGIQDKVNEYLDRVQALHNAGKLSWGETQGTSAFILLLLVFSDVLNHSE